MTFFAKIFKMKIVLSLYNSARTDVTPVTKVSSDFNYLFY